MREFDVTGKSLANRASSNGDQRKWILDTEQGKVFIKEQLYLKRWWKDNLVEKIASTICKQLDADWLRFADYELCTINDGDQITEGCYSYNFLKENENLITMHDLTTMSGLTLLYSDTVPDIYLKLLNTITMFGIERATEYLSILFLVDFLVCNTDRHLGNIAACKTSSEYTTGPLFDFGQGLFQGSYAFAILPIREMIDSLVCKPYMRSFKEVMKFFWSQGAIRSYIPKRLDVSGLQFPDFNSAVVLGLQCKALDIELRGVEKPNGIN